MFLVFFFFFSSRRRHTRCGRDWSSDVCSSDLDRVGEVLGLHYAVPWPNRELETARPFRRSPAYHLLREAGACFGSKMGWERANFFAPPGERPVIEYAWGKQNWQPWSSAEQRATRQAVAIFDQTSFSKYLVTGQDAEQALQWLCT